MSDNDFPEWFTIDEQGLDSLCYFLRKHYKNKTILIKVETEKSDELLPELREYITGGK